MASENMKLVTDLLQTYGGRDKVLRILSYGSLLLAGLVRSPTKSKKLMTVFAELGACRTVLRLFDDLPMLSYSLSYGWGAQTKSLWLRVLGLANNLCDQLYYPLEHIAWAADKKLIHASSSPWWAMCIAAWGLSLSMNILRSLTMLLALRRARMRLEEENQMEDPTGTSSRQEESLQGKQISDLQKAERSHVLEIIKHGADLFNAIHWMPAGFLWGTKLPNTIVGFFGTISSILYFRSLVLQAQAKIVQ